MNRFKKFFAPRMQVQEQEFSESIRSITGYKPADLNLYLTAFTHRSMGFKNELGHVVSYERLEFLGDAILGAVIAEYIYNKVPEGDEGYLTKMRSKIVSREHLNELGLDFQLLKLVKSQVPLKNFGNNIHGNLFEALVGAIYLDRGYLICRKFICKKVIEPYVDIEKLEGKVISYKSLVIEWCQKNKKQFDFNTYEDTGAGEIKHFAVKLCIDGRQIAKARETSKKRAEEKASKRAFFVLQEKMEA
jgi:ribonuclease-3